MHPWRARRLREDRRDREPERASPLRIGILPQEPYGSLDPPPILRDVHSYGRLLMVSVGPRKLDHGVSAVAALCCKGFRVARLTRHFAHDYYGVRAERVARGPRHGTRQVGAFSGRDED
jgi:hypothetical protein